MKYKIIHNPNKVKEYPPLNEDFSGRQSSGRLKTELHLHGPPRAKLGDVNLCSTVSILHLSYTFSSDMKFIVWGQLGVWMQSRLFTMRLQLITLKFGITLFRMDCGYGRSSCRTKQTSTFNFGSIRLPKRRLGQCLNLRLIWTIFIHNTGRLVFVALVKVYSSSSNRHLIV